MKYFCFAIYDSVSRSFAPPFHMASPNVAVRAFALGVNSAESHLSKHPTDYTLFQIGTFDDETGIHLPQEPHVNLGLGASFKKEHQNAPQ